MRTIRPLVPALASGLLVLSTAAAVHAQDGRNFLEQLFGAPARPAPVQTVQPVQPGYTPGGYGYAERSYRRSGYARQQRLKIRYAALPKAETLDPVKQPVDQKAIQDNPTKAILNDKTLRPGDIVVLPGGPRVFTGGGSGKRHRMSDFEDVKNSGLVDKKTRQQLLAMMVPVGAMPADQARKVMAKKHKLAQPDEIAAAEAHQEARNEAGARVINPWNAAR